MLEHGNTPQLKVERSSAVIAVRGPQAPSMFFGDGVGEREAKTRAGRLRRYEWVENVGHFLGCDTSAGIAYFEQ